MTFTHNKYNIYIEVGYEGKIDDFSLKNAPADIKYRDTITVKGRFGSEILAIYDKRMIDKEDLQVIQRHNQKKALLESGEEIFYYNFTHLHFLETLRDRKFNMSQKHGFEDDGTIFGTVGDADSQIVWNCWDDNFEIEDHPSKPK